MNDIRRWIMLIESEISSMWDSFIPAKKKVKKYGTPKAGELNNVRGVYPGLSMEWKKYLVLPKNAHIKERIDTDKDFQGYRDKYMAKYNHQIRKQNLPNSEKHLEVDPYPDESLNSLLRRTTNRVYKLWPEVFKNRDLYDP